MRTGKIKALQRKFKALHNWNIRYRRASKDMRAIVCIHPKKRDAVIYGYGAKTVPQDFVFHELMHCAIREVIRMDKRKKKQQREAEEELIRNICKIKLS